MISLVILTGEMKKFLKENSLFFGKNKLILAIIIMVGCIGVFLYLAERKMPGYLLHRQILVRENIASQPGKLQCISLKEASKHIGEYNCVQGKIDHIYISSRGNIFLDFCRDWRNCPFSAVIFKSDAKNFPDIKAYEKEIVNISGLIKTYQGRPEIVLKEPNQIKLKQ